MYVRACFFIGYLLTSYSNRGKGSRNGCSKFNVPRKGGLEDVGGLLIRGTLYKIGIYLTGNRVCFAFVHYITPSKPPNRHFTITLNSCMSC